MPTGKKNSEAAAAHEKAVRDNTANQCNPNHPTYGGHQPGFQGKGNKPDLDNHAKQLNPNNSLFKAPGPK
jgi:hypothetical protein